MTVSTSRPIGDRDLEFAAVFAAVNLILINTKRNRRPEQVEAMLEAAGSCRSRMHFRSPCGAAIS
jgi:hypothetical protein